MWQAISDSAAKYPDKDCLVGARDDGEIGRLTYSGLVERVRNFSTGLARTGVRRGDRVVLWMTNSLDWVVASFAIMRLGATVVPVNTFLKPPEIRYVIAQSGARHLIMLDAFRKLDMPEMLAEICPAFADADQPGNLCEPSLPDLRHVIMLSRTGKRHPGTHDFEVVEGIGRNDDGQWLDIADTMAAAVRPSDLAMVKYTSGSTGFPKGVMLEQGGMIASGVIHARRVGASDKDVFFSMMPFFHGGGSIWGQMTMLVNGGKLVFTEAFDPRIAVRLLDEEKATIMFGVLANEVIDEAMARGTVFTSLRTAHVPSEDGRKVMPNVDFNILPFGLTESYGPAAVSSREDPPGAAMRCGRMLDGYELRVVDPATGRDVGYGEPGEAWVRGNVMRGYWDKPEETARVITEDGWLRSEDVVSVDEEGFVSYVGRIKLMLKVGGENVSIEEVESVVESHDAIAGCGAVGVPDERRQEVVRVYVTRRPGQDIGEDELRPWLEARLARFKQPRDIVFVDELPHLANGKLDRVTLQGWADEETAA
ncbi:MAG: acyl--CoA ligase [Novosphingobium sp.]|nr:acyl--CoA ligase [Novosphingobium sp.]